MSDDLRARLLDWAELVDVPGVVMIAVALGSELARDLREAASALAIRGQEHEEKDDDQARRDKRDSSERQPAASKDETASG